MSRAKENWFFFVSMAIVAMLFGRPSLLISNFTVDVVSDASGFVVLIIGLLLRVVSRSWKLEHGNGDLVTDGPYGIVRNPMYVGSFLCGLGLCLIYGSLPLLLTFTAVFAITHHSVAHREERHLRSVMPERYARYAKRTPAWFPSVTAFGRLLVKSVFWIRETPQALIRERSAIGGNLIAACLAEAAADRLVLGGAASHEVTAWVGAALALACIWLFVAGRASILRRSSG